MVISCADPPVELAEVEGYATAHQGTTYQGTTYQGTTYQGTTYQGTTYQGATNGAMSATGKIASKTTLELWRQLSDGEWEQRLPDRVCLWDSQRTFSECGPTLNLSLVPSPLAGFKFKVTFADPITNAKRAGFMRIGSSATDQNAVHRDTSRAMHRLAGAGAGPIATCENPLGCALNNDLWLYDIDLIDPDGAVFDACPPGERATALAGRWDETGAFTPSSTSFTFACTSGTIAKCTRWGYRPFGSAQKSNGDSALLADYHQACIRAARADYCATGYSFTRNGTAIDIYDYKPSAGESGFVPDLKSIMPSATAFLWESTFDKHMATLVDSTRHLQTGILANECPRFWERGVPLPGNPVRRLTPPAVLPQISVDSSTQCPHAESTVGRWLNRKCSICTQYVVQTMPSCAQSTGGWTSECVALADGCGAFQMATHSECVTGAPLERYDTACTAAVCGLDPNCCSSGWTSKCTTAANATCT
ncbi:MAG TPA: ADYC domain-containing protein, partial [Kofleriaceae bacterium]|nr:ADYC domain-containing protein [Kofleriaceae bacterium]